MACTNCDHTMCGLFGPTETRASALQYWWCPRCGTLDCPDDEGVSTPALVERVREVIARRRVPLEPLCSGGVVESCLPPNYRPE